MLACNENKISDVREQTRPVKESFFHGYKNKVASTLQILTFSVSCIKSCAIFTSAMLRIRRAPTQNRAFPYLQFGNES